MKYDYTVIGAGPAGSIAAQRASKGHEVALIGSEHVIQCAGLLSISGLKRLGVEHNGYVLNRVRGAKLVSPLGFETLIESDAGKAYVVDRLMFDRYLVDRAINAGVTYISSNVDRVDASIMTSSGEEVACDKIILATGTNYTLQKKIGLECPKDFLVGVQYEMDLECDRDFVELHFVVPDFFAWVIPVDGYARVGLCARQNAKKKLDDFVTTLRRKGRLRSERKISQVYGIVPIHNPSMRTQYDRIVTVGDAAGQVKASTGGGVIFGGLAAEVACSKDYEAEWRARIGRDLYLHLMMHRFLSKLKPKNKDRFLRVVEHYKKEIEGAGDMDMASKTLWGVMRNPRLAADFALNMPLFLADLI